MEACVLLCLGLRMGVVVAVAGTVTVTMTVAGTTIGTVVVIALDGGEGLIFVLWWGKRDGIGVRCDGEM